MAHHSVVWRTYDFRPPRWLPRQRLNSQTLVLVLLSGGWLLLYAWLGAQLWHGGVLAAGRLELMLTAACIVLGIPLALGWWGVVRRWRMRLRPAVWPAMTVPQLLELTPSEFEEYVAQRIFARQGYAVINTPDVQDGGVDIIVTDVHGRQAVVQCKRYRGTVGEATIRDLYGAMMHFEAAMAYLVTTGNISDAARRWSQGKPIGLIDGSRLEELSRAEPALRAGSTT